MISEFAPAKLNLYLHIVGRRSDGYHLLDSLVAFLNIGDELTLHAESRLTLEVTGPTALQAGAAEDNLVMRAARALAHAAGGKSGARISLLKRLPAAAGLGGGSADAAAALRGLCRLWGIPPLDVDLHAVGRSIGQDVPVCIDSRSAYFRGVGDESDVALPPPALGVVLAKAGQGATTPEVFRARRGPFTFPDRLDPVPPDASAFLHEVAKRRNDLTHAASSLAPDIPRSIEALSGLPGCRVARMTGSGSACFGLFADLPSAESAAKRLRASHPEWWVAATTWYQP